MTQAPAVPPRTTCRDFVPHAEDTIVVAQQEFQPPAGLTWLNWASATVAHKDRAGTTARPACRAAGDLTEIIVHETVTRANRRNSTGRPNVQLILHRDGSFSQHADLAHDLNHANEHNRASFGFETVNPVLPRIARAPNNGLPPDLAAFPVIEDTIWTGQDKPRLKDDEGEPLEDENGKPVFGPARNRSRHYVRPTDVQLESATTLIEWATDSTIGHGMSIPLTWQGLRGTRFLFGRDDPLMTRLDPGIYAHGYFHHADGWLIVLYAWLRLDQGLSATDARDTAIDLAANHAHKHRETGGRRTPHIDLTSVLNPAPQPTP